MPRHDADHRPLRLRQVLRHRPRRRTLRPAPPDLAITWVELAGFVRGRALAAKLYEQATGIKAPFKASLADLRTWLLEEFCKRPHLIICDEAQHVSVEAMHLLRWLYDARGSQLMVVFSATPEKTFPPEIRSRCLTHIKLQRIPDERAAQYLTQMHPMFTLMDPGLIREMNKRDAGGEWRFWARFLARAVQYHPAGEPIDRAAAEILALDIDRG